MHEELLHPYHTSFPHGVRVSQSYSTLCSDGEPSLFSARSEVRCAQTTGIQSCKCGQSLPAHPSSAQRLRVATGVCNARFRSPNSSSSFVCMCIVHAHVYVDICMCAFRGVCTYLHTHVVASGSLHTWLWRQHLPRNMEIRKLASVLVNELQRSTHLHSTIPFLGL